MEDYDALVGNSKNMIDVEDDDLKDVGWHRGVSKAVQLLLSDEAEEARVSDILLLPIHSASGLRTLGSEPLPLPRSWLLL